MTLPDRPVDGAEIATDWGQEIHDRVFAPSGCEVHSGAARSCGTSQTALNLDVVDDDPGGYLSAADDWVEIPTAREGLYHAYAQCNTVNGSAGTGFQTRFHMTVNGTNVSSGIEDNNGGTNVVVPVGWVGILAAGDQIRFTAQRKGSGSNPDCSVTSFVLYRVGAELGA
jgi:hypothetical protein